MRRICFVLASCLIFCSTSMPQCFHTLSNFSSPDPSEWKDLMKRIPDQNEQGVIHVQRIEDGLGKINLDYYSITFDNPSHRSAADVFLDLRTHFNWFAHRMASPSDDVEEGKTFFWPYRFSLNENDPVRKDNDAKWRSRNPIGAVMIFALDTATPAVAYNTATFKGVKLVLKTAAVVVTCSTDTQFVFSTVKAKYLEDGYHPVSGNRGFGLRTNPDGTLTFYTMGADRETKMDPGSPFSGKPYFGNTIIKKGYIDRGIPPGDDAIFVAGDMFWRDFFSNLAEVLTNRGSKVNKSSFQRISARHPYPLP